MLVAVMEITIADRMIFTIRRIYNRTVGKYIFSCDYCGPTIFGISVISKQRVEMMFSKEADSNLKDGLSAEEYRSLRDTFDSIRILPRPGLPNFTFTETQKYEHNIHSIGSYYIFIRRTFETGN